MAGIIGQINRQPPQTPRTLAPSTDSREDKGRSEEGSEDTIMSGVPGNTMEEDRLAEFTESIHINPPEMVTMTEATRKQIVEQEMVFTRWEAENAINPHTGHQRIINIVDDEAVI